MASTEASRQENVYMAKLAEQDERYEEMVEFMEKVVKIVDVEELTVEERNLLSVAYKNVIGAGSCYCGARESVRISRNSEPDNLFDSAIAGFCTGAILGILQGDLADAIRYSIGISIVGTGVDFVAIKLRPVFKNMYKSVVVGDEKNKDRFKWPEWLPIQVLDEEALAAKCVREEALRARIRDLTKEES
ncbi:hypothetical protein L1987_46416 [Smallanthus sonchifolius]|uniref:Uncharacterized protein n=1 Tax=Smallanthus sonchifolius TaxID=185202 RepID=A0ACB9G0P1_9ASTR|nr:hypothetical protein L1987_46416 [Smallanthus sonchifolius]